MRHWITAVVASMAVALAAPVATAQVVSLGTTQGGATGQIATAIAGVVTQHGGLQVRPQALANTAQYIPQINGGQMDFGIANLPQTANAFSGSGMSEGQPGPNLRMVATLFPFNAGLVATKASNMRGYADLRGKRVPWYPERSLGDFIMRAALEAGGLTMNDVTRVPTPNFPRQFEAFKAGQIDVSIVAVGSQNTIDFETSIPGGIRFLSFQRSAEPIVARWLPGSTLRTMPVNAQNPGVEADTLVFAYDYTLFTNTTVSDDVVYRMTKAMFEQSAALMATSPLWSEYNPRDNAKQLGLVFHPGAIRFYREAGIWRGQ
jgi:TRAP transporter TAXI family solute receptor